jgi:hypothetical protein
MMMPSAARSIIVVAVALATATAQELPKKTVTGELNSNLILTEVPDARVLSDLLPGPVSTSGATPPPMDVVKLEAAVQNAKRSAALRERLVKQGIVSRYETEQSEMRVVRLTKDLENARLAAAQQDLEEKQKTPAKDEAGKAAIADAETRVAAAKKAAEEAAAKWEEAQRAAAVLRATRDRIMATNGNAWAALKQAEVALHKVIGPATP